MLLGFTAFCIEEMGYEVMGKVTHYGSEDLRVSVVQAGEGIME